MFSLLSFENGISSVKFYQESKIESDGTINISITYSAKTEEIEKNNNKIGNLPFTEEEVKLFFSSPETELLKSLVYEDPSDNTIKGVTVNISAKDINQLTGIKAFNEFKIYAVSRDTGVVFSWIVPASFVQNNSIDTYLFILNSESEIKSTNGLKNENKINWFVSADKINPAGAFFIATLKASFGSKTEIKSNENISENNVKGSSEPVDEISTGEKKKTCSIFGFEFPVIVLVGMIITKKKKNLSKKNIIL